MKRRTLLLCGLVGLLLFAGVAAGQQATVYVSGEPDLSVYAPTNTVEPGEETELSLQIVNEGEVDAGQATNGELVTTARNVIVNANVGGGMRVTTESKSVGSVSVNSPTDVPLELEVPRDTDPGTYRLTVDIDYQYTESVSQNRRGGGPPASSTSSASTTEQITVRVTDDPRFDVTEVNSNLHVGEEGKITGRLENTGRDGARNAGVSFAPNSETVVALETSVAVGDIPAGESVPFSIPVEVTSEAEAVPKRFDLPVSYRGENGIRQSDDDPEFLVDIGGQRDAFLVEPVNRSIAAGGSRPLDVRVTNNLNETVTDIEGKFFADDPLDSTNDETFTGSLDPGETTTATVDLSAAGGATIKNYPASVDFRYVDSEGDSKLTDSYRMAISVTEPEESGGSPLPLVIGLLVVAGGGFLAWRRGLFDRFTG